MGLSASLVLMTVLAAGPVEVVTLTGESHTGEMTVLNAEEVQLSGADGKIQVPLQSVLEVRLGNKPPADAEPAAIRVSLNDGADLGISDISVSGNEAVITSPELGSVKLPSSSLTSLRFASLDSKVAERWEELRIRAPKRDMLVIRKGDILDPIQGEVGDISAADVKFLLGSSVVPVGRAKVFGVVFARREPAKTKAVCNLLLTNGDSLPVAALKWTPDAWEAKSLAGSDITIPHDRLATADFSLGKVQYLSALEPRKLEHQPYFDTKWELKRDQNFEANPIRLRDKTFSRGLCIHSKTTVAWRLGKDYRRLKGIMGIEAAVAHTGYGDVEVSITGDGKPLLQTRVICTDEPRELDIDVTGVVMLEITVDYGGRHDISDHLALGDIRVIK